MWDSMAAIAPRDQRFVLLYRDYNLDLGVLNHGCIFSLGNAVSEVDQSGT